MKKRKTQKPKPVKVWGTTKNGRLTWIAQPYMTRPHIKNSAAISAMGEKLERFEVRKVED